MNTRELPHPSSIRQDLLLPSLTSKDFWLIQLKEGLEYTTLMMDNKVKTLHSNATGMAVHHTFATAGSDGTFNFWDKDSNQRLKAMSRCSQPYHAVLSTMMDQYSHIGLL